MKRNQLFGRARGEAGRGQLNHVLDVKQAMEARLAKLKRQPVAMVAAAAAQAAQTENLWATLAHAELDPHQARRGRIVSFARTEPAHASFGVLRTKVLRSLKLNKWTTVAITSPQPKCGKSVVATNLAFSLANVENCRVVLLDLDLRRPQISAILGPGIARPTAALLSGKSSIEEAFVRYGNNLAVSASRTGASSPAELLQSESARAALSEVRRRLNPDVMLLDLPPVLGSDDVLALLPNVDCTLLVVGAGLTTVAQVRQCERELASETNLLGMVLNKCQHAQNQGYY